MSRLAKLTWIALAFVTMIGLSACYPDNYNSNDGGKFRETTVTMTDGRIVPCLESHYSTSCDWANAKVPTYTTPTPAATGK